MSGGLGERYPSKNRPRREIPQPSAPQAAGSARGIFSRTRQCKMQPANQGLAGGFGLCRDGPLNKGRRQDAKLRFSFRSHSGHSSLHTKRFTAASAPLI